MDAKHDRGFGLRWLERPERIRRFNRNPLEWAAPCCAARKGISSRPRKKKNTAKLAVPCWFRGALGKEKLHIILSSPAALVNRCDAVIDVRWRWDFCFVFSFRSPQFLIILLWKFPLQFYIEDGIQNA